MHTSCHIEKRMETAAQTKLTVFPRQPRKNTEIKIDKICLVY